jgi:hypothetical protein
MRNSPAAESAGGVRAELLLRVLPWLACLFGVWPLLRGGFPQGHDVTYELVRISEYREAFAAGQWPPFWSEHLYAGYGSPVFLFYAPLFSAVASLASAFAGSVQAGATWLLVGISLVSVPLARGFLAALLEVTGLRDSAAARMGTLFFVVHPYLLGDKLVRNADAEFMGLCLTPLMLHGVAIAAREPRRGAALVSAGLALVVLAHNLTALVAVAFALGLGLVLHGVRARAAWLAIGAGIAAALAMTAFFWLPALALRDLIRPEELLHGKFDYRIQFPPLEKIFWYVRFFATGLLTPAVLVAAAGAALRFPAQRTILVSLLGAALGLLFLETPASAWLWEQIPWLPLFQFPWRMMGPLALVASALAALTAALALAGRTPRVRALAEVGFAALAIANAGPIVAQYVELSADETVMLDGLIRPEQIRNGAETVTAGDEYLPRASDRHVWIAQRPLDGAVVAASGPARWETARNGGTHIEMTTHAPAPVRLRLARFAFPGWRVAIDGAPGTWAPSPWGSLELEVPAGDARVEVWLEPPPLRRAGLWFSALAGVVWVAALAAARRRARASVASRG